MAHISDKKKILYVITQGEWGGAQRYVFDLATNLGPEYEVTVAVGEQKGRHDLQTRLDAYKNIKVKKLHHLVRSISPIHDWLAVGELADLYREVNPDIVHLNSSKAGVVGSYAVRRIPKISRPCIVYTAHGWVFDEPIAPWRQAMYRYFEKSTAPDKSSIIVLSRHDAERGEAVGVPKEKMHTVPHGIDPLQLRGIDPVYEDLGKYIADPTVEKYGKHYFVTIANLYPTKGIDVLIRAVAQGSIKLTSALFLIFGEGPERNRLEKLITEYHLEKNISLVGNLENAARLIKSGAVFVLPSRKEGLPYVLLEAMRARVPIIATRVGGIPELIEHKKSGLLVKPDSVGELSEALMFAAENPGVMKQYAENAPTPPALSEMIAKTTSLYRSCPARS